MRRQIVRTSESGTMRRHRIRTSDSTYNTRYNDKTNRIRTSDCNRQYKDQNVIYNDT